MSFKINSFHDAIIVDSIGNYFNNVFTTNSKFEEDYTSDGNTSLAKITKLNIF